MEALRHELERLRRERETALPLAGTPLGSGLGSGLGLGCSGVRVFGC